MNANMSLAKLKENFLATSTQSMPLAGMIYWTAALVGGLILAPRQHALAVAFGSGLIFPLAVVIDRLRGRNFLKAGRDNPLTQMFVQSVVMIALLWPLVILGGVGKPLFIVLGAAILTGIVWIPYGWAANDPVGMRHAVARALLCYVAYLFAPAELAASAICLAVLLCYGYSLACMRRGEVGLARVVQGVAVAD